MKIKIKVPSDLSEITLYDYQRYMNVIDNSNDELFIAQKTVSIFCNISLQQTLQININDIYSIVEHLKDVFNSKPLLQQRIKFKGHNLGFIPFVIVQWCLQSDISGGVATKMYTASLDWTSTTTFSAGTGGNQLHTKGGVSYAVTSSTLTITNNMVGQMKRFLSSGTETYRAYEGGVAIGYAYLIFDLQGA